MKILITGSKGLASALASVYAADHSVTMVSRSNGFDINYIDHWGHKFVNHDCVFNCAYDGFGQLHVLDFFYKHWSNMSEKKIINIGSRCITYPRLDADTAYWPYRQHKLSLQNTVDAMTACAQCDIKIINSGPVDTDMVAHQHCEKFDPVTLAEKIKIIAQDHTIKRVDLWL